MSSLGLDILVHGTEGVGKSWLGDSAPAPRLVLDAEGGSRFTPSRPKVSWDPQAAAPPAPGDWVTCRTTVRSYQDLELVHQWLASGQHPFRSVVLDQLTEIQARIKSHLVGTAGMEQQDWGSLLRLMDDLLRRYRDLVDEPWSLDAVVMIAATELRDGRWKPLLEGAMRNRIGHYTSVVGYMYTQVAEATGEIERRLLIQPTGTYAAKDRTHGLSQHYGPVVVNPDVGQMLAVHRQYHQEGVSQG